MFDRTKVFFFSLLASLSVLAFAVVTLLVTGDPYAFLLVAGGGTGLMAIGVLFPALTLSVLSGSSVATPPNTTTRVGSDAATASSAHAESNVSETARLRGGRLKKGRGWFDPTAARHRFEFPPTPSGLSVVLYCTEAGTWIREQSVLLSKDHSLPLGGEPPATLRGD